MTVEMIYLAGRDRLPKDAMAALQSMVAASLAPDQNADVTLVNLAVDRRDGVVEVRATLRGNRPSDLTSPVDALTRIDTAICQSLALLGLFEEFDVARRSLKAVPAEPARP